MKRCECRLWAWAVLCLSLFARPAWSQEASVWDAFDTDVYGYVEARSGFRTQSDDEQKNASVQELRLQLEALVTSPWFDVKYKGDLWGDGVTERIEHDTREAYIFARPTDAADVKIGRQILTWGTGDLVFVNDLFPKDWQSFFIGRDAEYLKAPSDAVKISLFSELANIDVVYSPQFDPDRFVTGEYLSYWSHEDSRLVGQLNRLSTDIPSEWWRDGELDLRLYRNIHGYELAAYSHQGYWKRPAGKNPSGLNAFPRLQTYGASVRGQIGQGIGNAEFAYYRSSDDLSGSDPDVRNSELRYLVGYAQELAQDLNVSAQYYFEHMLDYSAYRENYTGTKARDRLRQVMTLQITQLLMGQNLELSASAYYSPTDDDAYIRPHLAYNYTDDVVLEAGANVFFGNDESTFFAQFHNNTNAYVSVRYSF